MDRRKDPDRVRGISGRIRDRYGLTVDEGYSFTTLVVAVIIALAIGYFVGHAAAMSSAEASVIDCYNTHIVGINPSGQGFVTCLQNEGMSISIQE